MRYRVRLTYERRKLAIWERWLQFREWAGYSRKWFDE